MPHNASALANAGFDQATLARHCNEQNYTVTASIQPFAVLFVCNEQFIIQKISANAASIGKKTEDLLGNPLLSLLAEASATHFTDLMNSELDEADRHYVQWEWSNSSGFSVATGEGFLFRSGSHICLEMMLPDAPQPAPTHYARKIEAAKKINKFQGDLGEFATLLTQQISELTGFDRLFCFRFDESGNGMVIGETRNEVYASLAQHHFPASDIPANLHEVYRKNRFRHLPDRAYKQVPLLEKKGASQPLDLSLSLSRQVGATHLQYQENMGVVSSLSFSIIIGGKLWGLLGGHHHLPRPLPLQTLLDVQLLVELFANKLTAIIESTEKQKLNERLSSILSLTLAFEQVNCDLATLNASHGEQLKTLMGADALLWVTQEGFGSHDMITQGNEALLIDFAKEKALAHSIFATSSLAKENPIFLAMADEVSGMLTLALDSNDLLIWLRIEQLQQRKWGGNPATALQVDATGKIGPRQSFATWIEQVRHTSLAWENADISTAQELKASFSSVKLHYNNRLQEQNTLLAAEIEERKLVEVALRETNRQLESFAYIASHDLQEPLRMVASYCQLLERRYATKLDGTALQYLTYAVQGAKRMRGLLDYILEYSRLSSNVQHKEPVSLEGILVDVRHALDYSIKEANATITADPLPSLFAEKTQIYQLLLNLVGNALKFRIVDKPVTIHLSSIEEDDFWKISVSDNGIGIAPDMQQKVFEMFQRLNPGEYDGTGIGLALCRRIVELHNGHIWFGSIPAQGTTFFFTIPLTISEETENIL